MSDQPTQGLVKPIDLGNRNLLGLRPAQASLYKYLKKCSDEGTTVQLDAVVKIYWEEVKPAKKVFRDGWYYTTYSNKNDPMYSILNKDMPAYFKEKKDDSRYSYWIERPAKQWMQHTIGSLVMRGLLTVIPNLETQITEDDKSSPDRD